jgi:hypothetical protein
MGTLHEDQYMFMIICQLILEWEIFWGTEFVEKYQQMHYLKLYVYFHIQFFQTPISFDWNINEFWWIICDSVYN